jgi:hypothetical protein
VLDHVFTDAIGALREALEKAMLERVAVEEHLNHDMLLGDLTWETSYGLPGEGVPSRVRADLGLTWTTWSQTAFRDWMTGEGFADAPHIDIEITLRIQRLAEPVDPTVVLAKLPDESPPIGNEPLYRSGPTLETVYSPELTDPEYAIEVAYEGSYELDEDALADGSRLDEHFAAMGGWITATLVRLGDLNLQFHPDDPDE